MTLPLRMELTLRYFLSLLRRLVSYLRRRWDQSIRRLWYIFSFVRSRFSSRHPKGDVVIRRNIESRRANPPPAVICASRLPPGDSGTPVITSPGPIPTQVRQPTISSDSDSLSYATLEDQTTEHRGVDDHHLEEGRQVQLDSAGHRDESESTHVVLPPPIITSPTPIPIRRLRTLGPGDPLYETEENYSNDHSGVDGYRLAASGTISKSNSNQDENEHTHIVPQNEDITDSPVIPSLPISRPHSQYSRSQPHHAGYPPPWQHSQPLPSMYRAPNDRLRPMIGIDRYERRELVVVENEINEHILPPVTTQFVR